MKDETRVVRRKAAIDPPELKSALADYIAGDGSAHGLDCITKPRSLRKLDDTILRPRQLNYVVQFSGPTGSNALEAALKLARKIPGRPQHHSVHQRRSWHEAWRLSCTGNRYHRAAAAQLLGGVTRLPYDRYLGFTVTRAILITCCRIPLVAWTA